MRAAVIYEHGGPGSIKYETHFPDPVPGPHDVVVRVRATSLNYHDLFTRRGMPGIKVPMPCIMGIDFAGEIVELGSAVRDWKIGERVLIDPVDWVTNGGLIGEMWHGGLAEFCKLPTHHLLRLPDDVAYADAACLPVAYGTALRMMYTIGRVKAGEKVLILGASGGVGTCCVQLAKLAGCEVIACASSDTKLERLKQLGADHILDYTRHKLTDWVYERFGKPRRRQFTNGVDVVVNFTGGDTWVPSLRILHRQGKLLTCGATAGFDPKEDIRYIWTFELQVLGSNGWMREDVEQLFELVRGRKLKPVIDRTFALDHVNEAFGALENREVFGKVVVLP
ncbi:MAG: zinc-binding dehydrogenase [Betaproteobacteria bacterium RIFCSPLOWO2_12_FULL_62_13]|nr:MAG: zinc-binding dehydrogenase [Betaproteobacteria bacterium RIFCSPLOWO2_12_FULL_62_13]